MNFMREKIKHYCFYHLCHVFDVTLTNNLLILNISMGEIKGKMYSNKVIILNWYLLHVLSLISSIQPIISPACHIFPYCSAPTFHFLPFIGLKIKYNPDLTLVLFSWHSSKNLKSILVFTYLKGQTWTLSIDVFRVISLMTGNLRVLL